MDTETSVKVSYATIIKRVAAYIVDQIIFSVFLLFILFISSDKLFTEFFNYIFSDTDTALSVQNEVLEALIYIVLEVLMITKLGWTPGKLLCGIYIKDANTPKNVALMQGVIRSTIKVLLWVPIYISEWFFILPILVLIFAVFDRRKQFFHDKIAKTVVMDYKSEKCHLNANYVGIIRRALPYIIDRCTIMGVVSVCLIFVRIIFHPAKLTLLIVHISLFFLLPIVLGVFITRRLGSTPGQWLCRICIKNANTLENITLMQAIIRCVLFEVINFILISIFFMNVFLFDQYISEWWFEPLSILTFIAIILIFTSAIFDRRKQFLHDKIAKTVAIDHKPS
ncbi:RDD family protein [Wolbachia endosymbiont of Cantharis cryptica]|uniref:RDD family protein n=1 Tax=Wolbachia endosymbiont of Cantharis cryptica TaxID=3066132 RepID=UPI00376EFC84